MTPDTTQKFLSGLGYAGNLAQIGVFDIAKLFLATAEIYAEDCLHVKSIFDIVYANGQQSYMIYIKG